VRPERDAPLFSVITAVRNGAATLQAAIDSVVAQTCRDFEYIVLDGASTDDTVALLTRNSRHLDHWVSEPDTGVYDAWNKALRLARGHWIAFLGADDTYFPDALASYAEYIAANETAGLQYVSSRVELVKNGKVVRTLGSAWSWPLFSRYMTVAHVGSIHHRSLFERYGRFDASYRSCGDYELLLRPRGALRAGFMNRVTARMSLGGISNANSRRALDEQQRAKRTAGGRAAWKCALERRSAHLRDTVRSLLWY
jgi:glycosyltransferase involved in cell wall biosynthesis